MTFECIEIRLSAELLEAAHDAAAAQDVTLGQLIRDALEREVRRATPKTRNSADEALVARLQRLLAADIASATSWDELHRVLWKKRYCLRPAGGGLTLHDAQGRRLCKSSELGFGYARSVKRFGCAMPGHPHRMAHLVRPQITPEKADAFVVIEPF